MNMKRLTVGLGMVLIMALALGSAEAKPFHSEDSGSYVSEGTRIDTDVVDGRTADLVLTSGKGSLGATTTQAVVEWPKNFEPATCPNGNEGFEGILVSGGFVTRAANGDLLFGTFSSGTNCFTPATNSASFSPSGVFTGGTGKFAGASGGSITVRGTAIPVTAYGDLLWNKFGSVVSRTEGTLP